MPPTNSTRSNLKLALLTSVGTACYQSLFLSTHTYDYYRPLFVFEFLFVVLSVHSWVANKGAK